MTETRRIETADGLTLHAIEAGPADGPAVVLVHGWPDTHDVWRHQVPALAAAGYRTITYDQRGFGASDRPAETAGYHVFNAMADVGSVLDAFEIDAAHLVGHDWGAPPCWLAATFAYERVTSLTAMSVGHPLAFRNAGFEQRQKSFYMLLFQFEEVAEQWLTMDDWANLKELIGDLENWDQRRIELERPGALTSSLSWYRANQSPESLVAPAPDLAPITVPTLGITGSDDWALLPKQMIESEQHIDAEWRHEVIEGAAHWMQTDKPAEVNAILLEWLEAHS